MPAIVGIVALDTPDAINLGLPMPEVAITSNTEIMPVTVPINPNSGQTATRVLIMGRYCCALR